jgi:alpha-D-ribose 1-methylphosphonate 5-triphosphate synthase subunit PhnI
MRSRRVSRLTLAATLGQTVWEVGRRWEALPARRRARLQDLLRKSGGRPSSLSASERREVRMIVAELKLGEVMREISQRASTRRR